MSIALSIPPFLDVHAAREGRGPSSLTHPSCNRADLHKYFLFKVSTKGFLPRIALVENLTTLKFMGSFPPLLLFWKAGWLCAFLQYSVISLPPNNPGLSVSNCILSQLLERTSFKQGMRCYTIFLSMLGFIFFLTMGIMPFLDCNGWRKYSYKLETKCSSTSSVNTLFIH